MKLVECAKRGNTHTSLSDVKSETHLTILAAERRVAGSFELFRLIEVFDRPAAR